MTLWLYVFPKDKISCLLSQNISILLYFANNIAVCFDQQDIYTNYFVNKYYSMYGEENLSELDFLTYVKKNIQRNYLMAKRVRV